MKVWLILIFCIPFVNANIILTEIMADPITDEDLNEYLEIYNNGTESVDASLLMIGDYKDNDSIEGGLFKGTGTILAPFSYAIITDEKTRVYNNFNIKNSLKLYVDDSGIASGLKNSGNALFLYFNGTLIQEVEYNKTKDGFSWSWNNGWFISEPSPGNSSHLRKGCDWKVDLLIDDVFVSEWKVVVSKVYGDKTDINVSRSIQNSKGDVIKKYDDLFLENLTYRKTLSYTPNLHEGDAYFLDSEIFVECDSNNENNYVKKMIFIPKEELPKDSNLELVKIYDLGNDKIAKWGQTIKVKINSYRGDTGKKNVKIWVEKEGVRASKEHSINVNHKYSAFEATIPIQLKPNCDGRLLDGSYEIMASGLDNDDSKKVIIQNISKDLCKEVIVEKNITIVQKHEEKPKSAPLNNDTKTYLNEKNSNSISGEVVYESKEVKAKNFAKYLFMISLTFITILSVFENGRKTKNKGKNCT